MLEFGRPVTLVSVLVAAIIASLLVVSSVQAAAAPGGSPAPSVQMPIQDAKGKNCVVPGIGVLADGDEVIEQDDPGYNTYTCSNGRLCAYAHIKGITFKTCWYTGTVKRATI
jgi:hypothetical protein